MTNRPRRWLEINGHVNALSNHMERHGYNRRKVDTLARKYKTRSAELPLDVLSEFFGCPVKQVSQPGNWQEILYGSKRGAQKDVPKGKPKRGCAPRKAKRVDVTADPVARFLRMRLTRTPSDHACYY